MEEKMEVKEKRKSQRRSSFAVSRIDILQRSPVGEELYSDIDGSLSKEQRLVALTKRCVDHALKKMEEEFTGSGDFNTLKKEVEEAVYRKIADMEVNGMFKDATENKKTLPNPINEEMDLAIGDMKAKISRLQEESNNWVKLLQNTEKKLTEVDEKSTAPSLTEEDIPDTLKAQSGQYLCNRLDYNSLLTELNDNCQRTALMVNEHDRIVKKINTAFDIVSSQLNSYMLERKEELIPIETPRREIQSMLTFPTPR